MNKTEAFEFLNGSRRAFSDVNERLNRFGDSELARWVGSLADVEKVDADRYLDAITNGDFEPPKFRSEWDIFPAHVRKWCKHNRIPKLKTEQSQFPNDDRRFSCNICWDRNWVEVISPRFVSEHRNKINAFEINPKLPENTRVEADRFVREARGWLKVKMLPLYAAVLCRCDQGERQFKAIEAKTGERVCRYDARRMPLVKGRSSIELIEAMKLFVANNSEDDAFEWVP